MNRKAYKIFSVAVIFFASTLFCSCSIKEYWEKAILGKLPFVKNVIQKQYKTYTSITNIRSEMKLVTAKQHLDFINIMDGKDGRYLEVSTYEVKAGIDFAKNEVGIDADGNKTVLFSNVEILSVGKIHSVVARGNAEKNNSEFYTNCIKPVNIAYEQKAQDYAVELGLLEKAKEGAERTVKNLTGIKAAIDVGEYKTEIEMPYIPLKLEVRAKFLQDAKLAQIKLPENHFNRDAAVFENVNGWKIRIGDSGRTFDGTFDDFYSNVFATNTNSSSSGKDKVEIFRYFDPLYPKENEVLSYASDYYRTFFLLSRGRIYYIDAEYKDEQTLLSDISPMTVYLASSLRTVIDKKVERADEYEKYISKYFDAAESLRLNDDRITVDMKVEDLIAANSLQIVFENADIDALSSNKKEYTMDEKYFKAMANVKNLGRTDSDRTVISTGDSEFDSINNLVTQLYFSNENTESQFNSNDVRENAIRTATGLNERIRKSEGINLGLAQYLRAYFLQNAVKFNLSEQERQRYSNDLNGGLATIASRPLIAMMTDSERNKYFYDLFRNRLSMSHYHIDTAQKIDDKLKVSDRGSLKFMYFNIPEFEELSDGDIYERMKEMNNGHEINDAFVLVFGQTEFDFGLVGSDEDIHAFVLDDSTLRFFPNVGSQNFWEKITGDIKKFFFRKDAVPEFYYYGDWKRLRVTSENVSVAGHNFATKKLTQKGKSEYRNTNDYAEKSTIATVIDDLQHAYSSEDADYYYRMLCENLEYQVQHYVYEKVFRPSPRMVLDMRKDAMLRYNH